VLIEEDAQQTRQLLGRVQSALGRKEQGRGEILGLGFLARTLHRHATRVTTRPRSAICVAVNQHRIMPFPLMACF
jgi:hypothetical protein